MKQGGSRKGSGRKKIFNDPTIINFKCESSDKIKLQEKYGKDLNKMFAKWIKRLLTKH